jgi:hypothetical protein
MTGFGTSMVVLLHLHMLEKHGVDAFLLSIS